jgi:hypothetical protein
VFPVRDNAICATAEGAAGERKRQEFDVRDCAAVEMKEGVLVDTDCKMRRIAE